MLLVRMLRHRLNTLKLFLLTIATCRFTKVRDVYSLLLITLLKLTPLYSTHPLTRELQFYPTVTNNALVKCADFWYYCRGSSDDLYHSQVAYEKPVRGIILNSLREGDVFIDVGANVGSHTIHASRKVGLNGIVFAIEPLQENVKILKRNISLNNCSNVLVAPYAAASRKGRVKLFYSPYHTGGTTQSFRGNSINAFVESASLDNLIEDRINPSRSIGVMKIDAEGAENEVLRGASNTLRRTRKVIIEIHHNQNLQLDGFVCEKKTTTWGVYLICTNSTMIS